MPKLWQRLKLCVRRHQRTYEYGASKIADSSPVSRPITGSTYLFGVFLSYISSAWANLEPSVDNHSEDRGDSRAGVSKEVFPQLGRKMEMTQRIVCRYGAGCTHTDYQHKEQYWHPAKKDFSREQYHTHYICNECGDGFLNLANLQVCVMRL